MFLLHRRWLCHSKQTGNTTAEHCAMGTDNNLLLEPVQEILEHSLVLVSETQIDLLYL